MKKEGVSKPRPTLDAIRNELNEHQKAFLNYCWNHFLRKGEWPFTFDVHREFDPIHLVERFENFGGSLVWETGGIQDLRYELRLVGVLATENGPAYQRWMTKLFEYLRDQYMDRKIADVKTLEYESKKLSEVLNLNSDEIRILGTISRIDSTFASYGHTKDGDWKIKVPNDIDAIILREGPLDERYEEVALRHFDRESRFTVGERLSSFSGNWDRRVNEHRNHKVQIEKWVLLRLIGKGGQATVHEAKTGEGDQIVALKLVELKYPKKTARFRRELEQHARLSKAGAVGIIPILDHGIWSKGKNGEQGYIVMPKATQSLEGCHKTFILRPDLCLEVFAAILQGVAQAHTAGIIHRDIKPANILFLDTALRQPVLSDFGICFLKNTPKSDRLTGVEETVGARYFMAPEQEQGGQIEVKESADIYALGKVLHYMLSGRRMYREELERAFLPEELDTAPLLNSISERVLKKTIVARPEERIASVKELLEQVESLRASTTGNPATRIAIGPQEIGLPDQNPPIQRTLTENLSAVVEAFATYRGLLAQNRAAEVALEFDNFVHDFESGWAAAYASTKDSIERAPQTLNDLLISQPRVMGAILAMTRFDSMGLFEDFKRFVEFVARANESSAGYVAINEIPAAYAGYLYMVCATSALAHESWGILKELLNRPIAVPESQRTYYLPGYAHRALFHSEIFGRNAGAGHDFFRKKLAMQINPTLLKLRGDELYDKYFQVQMLMCIKSAKSCQESQSRHQIWADYGRFFSFRAQRLFERMSADRHYANGVCSAFDEDQESFFKNLNERLRFIKRHFWNDGEYLWESITEYEAPT